MEQVKEPLKFQFSPEKSETLQISVSHTLSDDQLNQIAAQVYETTLEAIQEARKVSKIDSDILFSKNELRKFLGNVSAEYLEELLADPSFPRGRQLSERKTVFFKSDIIRYLKK